MSCISISHTTSQKCVVGSKIWNNFIIMHILNQFVCFFNFSFLTKSFQKSSVCNLCLFYIILYLFYSFLFNFFFFIFIFRLFIYLIRNNFFAWHLIEIKLCQVHFSTTNTCIYQICI